MSHLIIIIFTMLVILSLEKKVKLRLRYQLFSRRFIKYYIDFVVLIIVIGVITAFTYAMLLTPLPFFIIECIFFSLFVYSVVVILPTDFLDELMKEIYKG